jgi:hypothetical protein
LIFIIASAVSIMPMTRMGVAPPACFSGGHSAWMRETTHSMWAGSFVLGSAMASMLRVRSWV